MAKRAVNGNGHEGSRSELAYTSLRSAIDAGRLRPGERLREEQIATWLRISRTPVRDALRRLEDDGVLSSAPRRGLVVAQFDQQQVSELYDVRALLEEHAGRFAAQRASESEVAALRELIQRQSDTPADQGPALARLNQLFHEVVYRAARNRYLVRLRDSLESSFALLPGWSDGTPRRTAEILKEHKAIVDAIERRDGATAGDLSRTHVRNDERVRMLLIAHESAESPREPAARRAAARAPKASS